VLEEELAERGLAILAFPCNQFAKQEPQGAEKIETCIRTKYSVAFPMLEKVLVNGPDTHPVFRWLRLKGSDEPLQINWNFNMFLVGRDGASCTRYNNTRTPSSIKEDIELALAAPASPSTAGA